MTIRLFRHFCVHFFVILFFAFDVHADTIGVYRVQLKGKTIAEVNEFHTIQLTFNADTIRSTDTLAIDYWSCGPRPGGKYRIVIIDSTSGDTVYHSINYSEDYTLPMQPLLAWKKTHPDAVFLGRFKQMTGTNREVIRIEVRFD